MDEMLGGDWEQGYVLSPRLHYQQKIFHSCITDIGTLLGDSIQDRLEDEANSAFSQITDVLNGKGQKKDMTCLCMTYYLKYKGIFYVS